MGTFMAYGSRISRRFGAAQMLALLAILLNVTAPLSAQFAASSADNLFETVICAGGEWKTVYLDAEGNPVDEAPAKAHHDCTSCLHHCGGAILSALAALPLVHWTLPLPAIAGQAALTEAHSGHKNSRAPPL